MINRMLAEHYEIQKHGPENIVVGKFSEFRSAYESLTTHPGEK